MTLDSAPEIQLAVLNCCESGRGSSQFLSLGAALVSNSTPMVVAMQYAITDDSAARFAGAFYSSIVGGQCVERALTSARKYMRFESNVEWGIPVSLPRRVPPHCSSSTYSRWPEPKKTQHGSRCTRAQRNEKRLSQSSDGLSNNQLMQGRTPWPPSQIRAF